MTVELLNNSGGEILDLTTAPEQEVETETEQETNVESNDDATETTESEGHNDDANVSDGGDDGDDVDSDKPEDAAKEDDEPEGEFFFGEQQVKVEVPDEIASALKEADIDQGELLKQLFKKDGDFSLDDEMRTKLEAKFGKTMVDGYLNMYKGVNEQALAKIASDKEAADKVLEQQGQAYADAVGGEEGLVKMEDYITKNFDDNQVAAYNAVMENGDHDSQMLIISQVKQLMSMADKLENGDKSVALQGDKDAVNSGIASPLDKGYLTNAEYNEIMAGDKYWEDSAYMAQVDAARMAGFKHDQ